MLLGSLELKCLGSCWGNYLFVYFRVLGLLELECLWAVAGNYLPNSRVLCSFFLTGSVVFVRTHLVYVTYILKVYSHSDRPLGLG